MLLVLTLVAGAKTLGLGLRAHNQFIKDYRRKVAQAKAEGRL